MANKVKFGLSNVYVAPITYGSGNAITYGTPFAIPGAVNLTLDAAGDNADFYADNTKYFSVYANQGYTGSLEMALLNEKFRTDILGEVKDSNGALVESSSATVKDFALGFQIDGDTANRRFWYYQVSAQRPSAGSQTIEATKEPVTESFDITAAARVSDGKVRVMMEKSSSNTTAYNNFFNAVYESVTSA